MDLLLRLGLLKYGYDEHERTQEQTNRAKGFPAGLADTQDLVWRRFEPKSRPVRTVQTASNPFFRR